MQMKRMARGLLTAGAIGLVYALLMDTTTATDYGGMRLINLHLQAKQQNFLMVSGLLLLMGVILFATATLKTSKDDEAAERAQQQAAKEGRRQARTEATQAAGKRLHSSGEWLRRQFAYDRKGRRLLAGLFVGVSLGILSTKAGMPWWLVAGACMAYAFRAGEAARYSSHLLLLNGLVFVIYSGFESFPFLHRDDIGAFELSWYATLMCLPGLFSIGALLIDRRLRKT